MTLIVKILIAVYYIAINIHGFLAVKRQKTCDDDCSGEKVRDSKLLITALLGGATGIFASAIILKHRRTSMFITVFMPLLIVINGYIAFLLFTNGLNAFFQIPT